MKTYSVTIRATVVKTLRVKAEDEETATTMAHEDFTVQLTDDLEDYEEETLRVEEAA
jgi:hypothetical protein